MKAILIIYLSVLLAATCNKQEKNTANAPAADTNVPSLPVPPQKSSINTPGSPDKDAVPVNQPDSDQPSPKPKRTESTAQNAGSYRLIVSFISKASGVDRKLHEKFKALLESYTPRVNPEVTPWGREGEVDYCLKLNELNANQQKDFVQKVRQAIGNTDMVYITENAGCVHKR